MTKVRLPQTEWEQALYSVTLMVVASDGTHVTAFSSSGRESFSTWVVDVIDPNDYSPRGSSSEGNKTDTAVEEEKKGK